MRSLLRILWAVLWMIVVVGVAPAEQTAQSPVAVPTQPSPATPQTAPAEDVAPVIWTAPSNDEEIQKRLERVSRELEELVRESPAASAPATQPADTEQRSVEQKLFDVLSLYRTQLERWQTIRRENARLKSSKAIEQFSEELEEWKRLKQTYGKLPETALHWVSASEVEKVSQLYDKWKNELAELTRRQTVREQTLSSLPKQRAKTQEETAATLAELNAFMADLAQELAKASGPQARRELLLRKRWLEWRHGLRLLAMAMYPDILTNLQLQQEQDTQRADVMGSLVTTLGTYRDRLLKIQSWSLADYAAEQAGRKDLPKYLRIYWESELTAAKATGSLQEVETAVRKRFSEAEYNALQQRLARAKGYWDDFMESLDRRPGEAVANAFPRLDAQIASDRRRLARLQSLLDLTIDEQKRVQDQKDEVLGRIDALRAEFDAQMAHLEGEQLVEARRLQARLTGEVRANVEARFDALITQEKSLRDRLHDAVRQLTAHIEQMAKYRSTLYWAHLTVRGRGPFDQDWSRLAAEWSQLRQGEGATADAWRDFWRKVRRQIHDCTTVDWTKLVILVVLAVALGYVCSRACRVRGDSGIAPNAGTTIPLGARIRLLLLSWVSRVSTPILVLSALLIWAAIVFGWRSPAGMVLLGVFGAVLVGFAASVLVDLAFQPSAPDRALLSAPPVTARYHRRWLKLLIGALLAAWTPVLFLRYSSLLPETYALLWPAAKILLLALLAGYFFRGDRFTELRLSDEPPGRLWANLRGKLPFLSAIGFVLLLVLELAGYGPLTSYLFRGLAWTLLIGVLVGLAWVTLREWSLPEAKRRESRPGGPESAAAPHPLTTIGAQILRLAVLVAALMLIFRVWGVTMVELKYVLDYQLGSVGGNPITLWRILAAVVTVIVGVLVSRALRAFLESQVFPEAHVISRGAQAAILTLLHYTIIALAAYFALAFMNLNLGALTVLLGTLGLGLGLGLQPLFINFISGLMILFEGQIRVGDIVEVDDKLGEVTGISLRSTKICSFDNIEWVIPNADFITGKVINWTLSNQRVRGKVNIGVAYGSNVELVRDLLLDIARRDPRVLAFPEPAVWFMNHGENSLDFTLVCWFANASRRWEFLTQVRYEIERVFREHNIEIPFPQRTLSVLGGRPLPIQLVQSAAPPPPPPADRTPEGPDASRETSEQS